MPEGRCRYAQVVAVNKWQTLCNSGSHCLVPSSQASGGWVQVLDGLKVGEVVVISVHRIGETDRKLLCSAVRFQPTDAVQVGIAIFGPYGAKNGTFTFKSLHASEN